jgi:hypothetical protein
MSLDTGYLICAQCGKGLDFEELVQNLPDDWKQIDLWALKNGREVQPYLSSLWVPLCPECGGGTFYPLIATDEIVEYFEECLEDGTLLSDAEEAQVRSLLELWRHRQQAEDQEWRHNVQQRRAASRDSETD